MRPTLPIVMAITVVALALTGCEEDELANGGTLVLDDDRTTGTAITVYIRLGSETPTTVQLGIGESKTVTLVQGTYTITFDDDTTGGPSAGDTVQSSVQIQTDKTTTVEYTAKGDSEVIGPNLQANG